MIITIIAFILIIGLLVVVHEFGHFIVAKKTGVKVEEFAVGFPPRVFSKKLGETEYSINLLPLGGYVKMLGELEHSTDKRAFENQKPGKRFLIAIAGVVMNLLLAWLLLTIGFSVGMSPVVSDPETIPGRILSSELIVADVLKDSIAEKAGLKPGNILVGAEAKNEKITFSKAQELTSFTNRYKGEEVKINYKDDAGTYTQNVTFPDQENPFGVAIVQKSIVRVPLLKAPVIALRETGEILKLTFEFLGGFFAKLFSRGQVAEEVGGPVAIYVYTGLAVKAGIMVLLQFVALLSINLALINILPFPALDGGRIVFIIIEKIAGKKVVKERVENIIHTVGYILLILLAITITYKDIIKLFPK